MSPLLKERLPAMRVCVCVRARTRGRTCMRTCVSVCLRMCVCVCVCVSVRPHIRVLVRLLMHVRTIFVCVSVLCQRFARLDRGAIEVQSRLRFGRR